MSDLSAEVALRGVTLTAVEGAIVGSEEVVFTTDDGRRFVFWHESDCCEDVRVDQVDGDVADLLDTPLVMAEEATEHFEPDGESATWTFYKFGTVNGYVTIRWLGTSNGYYSESVSLRQEAA